MDEELHAPVHVSVHEAPLQEQLGARLDCSGPASPLTFGAVHEADMQHLR